MLTKKEKEEAFNELNDFLDSNDLKKGLIYSLELPEDEKWNDIAGLNFSIETLPNAMYPNIFANLINKNEKIVFRIGFTKQEYFPYELSEKEPEEFNMDVMYDVAFLSNFKESLNLKINAEAYIKERDTLKVFLKQIEEIIEENDLE